MQEPDFEKFLREEAERQRDEVENDAAREAILRALTAEADARGLLHYLNADMTYNEQNCRDFIAHEYPVAREGLAIERPELLSRLDELEDAARNYAVFWLRAEATYERHVLYDTVHLIEQSLGVVTDYPDKKRYIASMLAAEGKSIGDAWVQFVNDMVPGDAFDPSAPADQRYVIEAFAALPDDETEVEDTAAAHSKICEMLGVGGSYEHITQDTNMPLLYAVDMIVLAAGNAAQISTQKDNARAERDAAVHQLLRQHAIPAQTMDELIAYLDQKWPIGR